MHPKRAAWVALLMGLSAKWEMEWPLMFLLNTGTFPEGISRAGKLVFCYQMIVSLILAACLSLYSKPSLLPLGRQHPCSRSLQVVPRALSPWVDQWPASPCAVGKTDVLGKRNGFSCSTHRRTNSFSQLLRKANSQNEQILNTGLHNFWLHILMVLLKAVYFLYHSLTHFKYRIG